MIIETLTKRRDQIAAQIRALTENLTHLDVIIKIVAAGWTSQSVDHTVLFGNSDIKQTPQTIITGALNNGIVQRN